MLNVTKTDLPPLQDVILYIDKIWKSGQVTNNGEMLQTFEKELKRFLKLESVPIVVSNGTLALQLALRSLNLKGSVITSPFSFVATRNAILLEGLEVDYADIDKDTWNLDPYEVRKKITTSTILAVNVFGNSCDFEGLQQVANDYNLKLIYDNSHGFGCQYNGISTSNFGDISTLSFHAAKTFSTLEGGAIISNVENQDEIKLLRNHGIIDEENFSSIGYNAKMDEVRATIGICNLKYYNQRCLSRKSINDIYVERLKDLKGIYFQKNINSKSNYSYFPVTFGSKEIRDTIYKALLNKGINSRKYFYPLLGGEGLEVEISKYISDRILCLPIYSQLDLIEDVFKVINIIEEELD